MTPDYVMIGLKLGGALALLIYGMRQMSEALQRMAGPQLRHILSRMTTNRLTGMLTGTLVTCAVQSSSATTVMTVSFVSAGLLTLAQAISVIMGANIGTTLTAWIMSLGYNVDLTSIVFPAFFVGMILIHKQRNRFLGEFLFGIAFMFFSLVMLSTSGKELDLEHNEDVVRFFASFDTGSYWTILSFLAIGTVITCIVQSSAAVMAITILLCSTGVLPVYLGIALVMGENIGTTATANLAALGANTQARRAALAHLLFNVIGVLWVLCVFYPFVDIVCSLVGYDPAAGGQTELLPVVLAMFHTCFNVTNTALLIGLIPQLERLVCRLLPMKEDENVSAEDDFRLLYIQANLMPTPEISLLQAQKETARFARHVQLMFGMVRLLLDEKNGDKAQKLFKEITRQEAVTDKMEEGIAQFLGQLSDNHTSSVTKVKVWQMMREIDELESIGDACNHLAFTLNRCREDGNWFTPELHVKARSLFQLLDSALTQMNRSMTGHGRDHHIEDSIRQEEAINEMCEELLEYNVSAIINRQYDYATGTLFSDLVVASGKLGDYVLNVVQARLGNEKMKVKSEK